MSSDDFDVIVYKVLAYIMACAKADVAPSIAKAREISKAGSVYWAMVARSMVADGLIVGISVETYYDGTSEVTAGTDFGITQRGAQYLRDNAKMREAAHLLGSAFTESLPILIEATKALL